MSLRVEKISDLRRYVEEYRGVPIFYERSDCSFSIRAGHASWKGELTEKDANALEAWLLEKDAMLTKGYIEDELLFSKGGSME